MFRGFIIKWEAMNLGKEDLKPMLVLNSLLAFFDPIKKLSLYHRTNRSFILVQDPDPSPKLGFFAVDDPDADIGIQQILQSSPKLFLF